MTPLVFAQSAAFDELLFILVALFKRHAVNCHIQVQTNGSPTLRVTPRDGRARQFIKHLWKDCNNWIRNSNDQQIRQDLDLGMEGVLRVKRHLSPISKSSVSALKNFWTNYTPVAIGLGSGAAAGAGVKVCAVAAKGSAVAKGATALKVVVAVAAVPTLPVLAVGAAVGAAVGGWWMWTSAEPDKTVARHSRESRR
ncbi:hypothetical protein BCR39DRAFT_511732 [Naematelia encephala]|uniref:Uncharacterized protein n=1 Tax=Naematelia encephala TaxID=71784 RepID=A0A1Y2BLT4_9TREE|nr:hypothetical protein BCR39DRAFT_511732 [Naematelia encephala]